MKMYKYVHQKTGGIHITPESKLKGDWKLVSEFETVTNDTKKEDVEKMAAAKKAAKKTATKKKVKKDGK